MAAIRTRRSRSILCFRRQSLSFALDIMTPTRYPVRWRILAFVSGAACFSLLLWLACRAGHPGQLTFDDYPRLKESSNVVFSVINRGQTAALVTCVTMWPTSNTTATTNWIRPLLQWVHPGDVSRIVVPRSPADEHVRVCVSYQQERTGASAVLGRVLYGLRSWRFKQAFQAGIVTGSYELRSTEVVR